MASASVTMDDTGLQRKLNKLEHGLADASPLMRIWGEIAQASIQENFEVGGRPKWKPLSPVTLALRRQARKGTASGRVAVSTRILVVTGTLKNVVVEPGRDTVRIGTQPAARAYAAIQQYGGMAGRNRKVSIPGRRYILLQPEDREEMKAAAQNYLQRLVKE